MSGTDGVGTKLKIAFEMDQHDTIGIDLVAMCVNDIIVHGAEPLYFLDYFATGALSVDVARQVIEGIATGCEQSGTTLVGGETAEMPGMYGDGEYDLAGFTVGVVEKSKIIDGSRVKSGDVVIGAQSSGVHSNGFSLIRKIVDSCKIPLHETIDGQPLGEILLTPTQIYVSSVHAVLKLVEVSALAHITGGGLRGNIKRVLPKNTKVVIDLGAWQMPVIFDWIMETGNVTKQNMLDTFNCGIGMVFIIDSASADAVCGILLGQGIQCWRIGQVETSSRSEQIEFLHI